MQANDASRLLVKALCKVLTYVTSSSHHDDDDVLTLMCRHILQDMQVNTKSENVLIYRSFSLTYSLVNVKGLLKFVSRNGTVVKYQIKRVVMNTFAFNRPTLCFHTHTHTTHKQAEKEPNGLNHIYMDTNLFIRFCCLFLVVVVECRCLASNDSVLHLHAYYSSGSC